MKTRIGFLAKVSLLLIITFLSTNAFAQLQATGEPEDVKTNYSEEELEKFVEARREIFKVQEETEREAINVIEENNLELRRFNEIYLIEKHDLDMEVSPEEWEAYKKSLKEVKDINDSAQVEFAKIILNHDLTANKFKNIMLAYERVTDFRVQIDEIILQKREE